MHFNEWLCHSDTCSLPSVSEELRCSQSVGVIKTIKAFDVPHKLFFFFFKKQCTSNSEELHEKQSCYEVQGFVLLWSLPAKAAPIVCDSVFLLGAVARTLIDSLVLQH